MLEINFKQMVSAVDIFSGDLTVDNMVMAMRFRFPEKKILPGKTLIWIFIFRRVSIVLIVDGRRIRRVLSPYAKMDIWMIFPGDGGSIKEIPTAKAN